MKIFRSKKALSPVVASIILIAVTVAVSIAVAAWMGALTFTFMGTEQLTITQVNFGTTGGNYLNVTMQNTGTTPITVNEVWVGGTKISSVSWYTSTGGAGTSTISANSLEIAKFNFAWTNGYNYQIKIVTSKGNQFYYSVTAPSA